MNDELRNRIGGIIFARGGAVSMGAACYVADEVILKLGLRVETVEGVMDPDGDYTARRVVGRWEKVDE